MNKLDALDQQDVLGFLKKYVNQPNYLQYVNLVNTTDWLSCDKAVGTLFRPNLIFYYIPFRLVFGYWTIFKGPSQARSACQYF